MRAPACRWQKISKLALGAMGEVVGNVRQQDLAGQGKTHQPGRDGLDQPFDLNRFGALGNVVSAVVPDHDIADMDADARCKLRLFDRIELAQAALVVERKGNRLHRTAKHHHEAVGLVDLLTAMALGKAACEPVMLADQLRRRDIADAFDQAGRVDQVAEQQGPQERTGRAVGFRIQSGQSAHVIELS